MHADRLPTETPSAPASARPTELTRLQAAALDDPRLVDAITQWQDGPLPAATMSIGGGADGLEDGATTAPPAASTQRIGRSRLLIAGMHCAACSGTIEAALCAIPGVQCAEVSGASERAVIVWDASRTRLSTLVEAVRRAGYGAYPDTGAQALDQARAETRQAIWRLFVAGICMMQVMMYAAPSYAMAPGEMSADLVTLLRWASWVLCIPVLVFAAGPYFRSAWTALRQRRIGMDLPVSLGIVVTFVAGTQATFAGQGEVYFDSLSMFVAVLLAARLLETRARRRAAQALDALMRRLPEAVERRVEVAPMDEGQGADAAAARFELVPAASLRPGDTVRVQLGQAFAADGVLLEGRTQVDEAALTGESTPVERAAGDDLHAGCLNVGAPVLMRVERVGAQTRFQRIVELVERALSERPAFVQATDRLAGPFLWAVLLLAGGAWLAWQWIDPARATWVAVSVLIVTCPCALSIGAPITLIAAAGRLARRGVLVQKLDALEALTRVDQVVFDKTGTLTEDRLHPAAFVPLEPHHPLLPAATAGRGPVPALADVAAALAAHSRHPLARALAQTATQTGPTGPAGMTAPTGTAAPVGPASSAPPAMLLRVSAVTEQAGAGLEGQLHASDGGAGLGAVAASRWRLGSAAWCGAGTAALDTVTRPAVWLARGIGDAAPATATAGDAPDGITWQPVLRIEFDEVLRPDTATALQTLQARGLGLALMSGDQPASVQGLLQRLLPRMADDSPDPAGEGGRAAPAEPLVDRQQRRGRIGALAWQAACTPQDKLDGLAALQAQGHHVLMVGDGVNDAPVLARADVSVAMGSAAALAQARADVVVVSNRLADIAELHAVARRAMAIVRQNLGWAVAYNLACVPLALAGWLPPWAAGLGMAGSSLAVVLNALRLTREGRTAQRAVPVGRGPIEPALPVAARLQP